MFDIDGTLTATSEIDAMCFAKAFSNCLGISITTDWATYRNVTHSSIALELYERHRGRPPAEDELHELQQNFLGLLAEALLNNPDASREIPGAKKLLSTLRRHPSVTVALATGGWGNAARLKLRYAGLPYERYAFASADNAIRREDIFLIAHKLAKQRSNVTQFKRVKYVGDGVWDFAAARAVGFDFVGLATGNRRQQLIAAGATTVFADYLGLTGVLSALIGNNSAVE